MSDGDHTANLHFIKLNSFMSLFKKQFKYTVDTAKNIENVQTTSNFFFYVVAFSKHRGRGKGVLRNIVDYVVT